MSITSWTRLEPHCRDDAMERTIQARVFDPLWMLTRQWQVGEFQGEDAGTPAIGRIRARTTLLSRCHLGPLDPNSNIQAPTYDPHAVPLEVMVERQRVRPAVSALRKLTLTIEAGLHFFRILDRQPASKSYREVFLARYALQPPEAEQLAQLDEESASFVETMAGRALDGRRLEAAFRSEGPQRVFIDPALQIAIADRAEVEQAAGQWLAWYGTLFDEPTEDVQAWIPERLEYAVSVAGRWSEAPHDQRTLSAEELYEGHLDWYDFDINEEVNLGTGTDRKFTSLVETAIPAPITFRGAPAPRFWELEDGRVAYGLVPVGPTDLAHLMLIEYASSYGNDWYVLPLDVEVGSLTTVQSLVVTDTFGVRTLHRSAGGADADRNWSMFQLARTQGSGGGIEPNLFFLAPALGRSVEGPALEEVLFLRDEMANVAWAVERTIENAVERSCERRAEITPPDDVSHAQSEGTPTYRLASDVPPHWIPLLPVQIRRGDEILQRLRRGAVLQADGSHRIHAAKGEILNAAADLLVEDQEVPREGVRVTRHHQLARWVNGATFLWTGLRKNSGRGEGSSGLRFDRIEERRLPGG